MGYVQINYTKSDMCPFTHGVPEYQHWWVIMRVILTPLDEAI